MARPNRCRIDNRCAGGIGPVSSDSDPLPTLQLPLDLGLSPEQFALVCAANPDAVLELAADGRLIDMPPTGGVTSRPNTHLLTRLQIWAERQGDLVVVDNSSTGFSFAGRQAP